MPSAPSAQTAQTDVQGSTQVLDLGIEGLINEVQVGRGGFATVYAADEPTLGRKVAVKVLRHLDDDGVRRFEREARILADLGSHENLAVIYRFERTRNGNPCFIMEYVPGGSLADELRRRGPIEPAVAVSHLRQVARALIHTHGRGIVHRDIKPSNILLTPDGRTKLSDFGIAMIRGASATLNAATFEHAAPEVFVNGATRNDERTDLYSLGSTLYTLVHGSAPYHVDGESSHEALLHRVLNAPIPTTALAPHFDGFWARALAKDPDERFQTASEMLAALTGLGRLDGSSGLAGSGGSGGAGSSAPPVSPPSPRAEPSPPAPVVPPPPMVGSTLPVDTTDEGPLSPQELAIVDSYATSSSVAQRRDVAALTSTQTVLFALAQDGDDTVATTAVERLDDESLLTQLVDPARPKRTRVLAARRITEGPVATRLVADPDPDVRAALAVGVSDPAIIGQLIKDPSPPVRAAVISQIDNTRVLRLIAQSPETETRRALAEQLDSGPLRVELARDADPSVRRAALAGLDAKAVLGLAADDDHAVSRSAMTFVTDPDALFDLSRHRNVHVQANALARLEADRKGSLAATLARIAGRPDHPQWQRALAAIDDQSVLSDLARSGHDAVATAALQRVTEPAALARLAVDGNFRHRRSVAERITDPAVLENLSSDDDAEVATVARAGLEASRERSEQLAAVRIALAAVIIIAIAVTVVWTSVWPQALLVVGGSIAAYRLWSDRR